MSHFKIVLLVIVLCGFVLTNTAIAEPYFSIDTDTEWLLYLNEDGEGPHISPLTPPQWDSYMLQWETYPIEGEPYPADTSFVTPQLYVYEGGGSSGDYNYPESPGLVMAWGPEPVPEGNYASAWAFDYGLDPDLSNSTIKITVMAPQFDAAGNQITTVSFGMRDINGNIRSWHWNCGAVGTPIIWNIPTTITINTALPGLSAASPAATGYVNNPAFDITKVQVFIVDENAKWVGGPTPVPPPGQTILKPWNYWDNLSVAANSSGGPIVAGINIDVHQDINVPGLDVNDFHVEGRIESGLPLSAGGGGWANPPTLKSHVDDLFTNFDCNITPDTSDPEQNWFIVKADWWTDTPIPYCTILHLGLEFEATCHNVIIDLVGWWTSHGQKVSGTLVNDGYVPIPGFRVTDGAPGLPGETNQVLRLQNGDADSNPEPGEIVTQIVELDLVSMTPPEVQEKLGSEPFKELRLGGLQESLPWKKVKHPGGGVINPGNPYDFAVDSFFDIYFELDINEGPLVMNAGDILIAREKITFTNNSGEPDYRWIWEIHEAHEGESDLGDAPDSTNNSGAIMTAYPWGIQANYPTVYLTGSPPHGPIHLMPRAVAYLGQAVTQEWEADIGFDQDPTNNIIPPTNQANLDFADDGVLNLPLKLPHCTSTTFNYLVNVISPGTNLYVNVWFDWNRDGDFDDTLVCPGSINAPERAVADQLLSGLPAGINNITTPAFMPWHPSSSSEPIWMRITLSEQQWTGSGSGVGVGGSGPVNGYQYGETEDYYFKPKITGFTCADYNLDKVVDFKDLAQVASQWLTTCP